MTEQNRRGLDLEAITGRYFAAWEARDPDAIVALHTEDTQFWAHAGIEPVSGREAVRAAFADLFERFPDFSFEAHRVLYGDDHWVLDWTLVSGEVRFDCIDVVSVSPGGLVARKDTFIDLVQLEASMTANGGSRASTISVGVSG